MRLASTLLAAMLGILTLPGCSLMPFDWFSSNAESVAAEAADPRVRYAEGRAHLAANRLGLALSAFQRAHFDSPADSQYRQCPRRHLRPAAAFRSGAEDTTVRRFCSTAAAHRP